MQCMLAVTFLSKSSKMNDKTLFSILKALFILFVLTSCQATDGRYQLAAIGGFGGTGQKMDPVSGFGGTGHQQGSSSGFGGTGIIGTITGFGSIWVNGIEIEYDENTPIKSDLSDKKVELKIGQQVVLETKPNDLETIADHIQVYHPIAGKIESVEKEQIQVNGHKVAITPATLLDKGIKLEKGAYIAVSALPGKGDTWQASRLNVNENKKVFYQPRPELNFSKHISRLIIEENLLKHSDLMDMQHLSVQFRHSHFNDLRELRSLREGGEWLRENRHESYEDLREQFERGRGIKELNEHFEENKNIQEMQEQSNELKELKEQSEYQKELHDLSHIDDD